GVDALLATEVLVHHRLGHLRRGGDLLDAGPLEPLGGEQAATHREQLLPALARGHPGTRGTLGRAGVGRHGSIMPGPRGPPCGPRHVALTSGSPGCARATPGDLADWAP